MLKKIKMYSWWEWCGGLFLFFVPWGTRWLYGQSPLFPPTEWGRLSWYGSEILAWIFVFSFFIPAVMRWKQTGFPVAHQEKWMRVAVLCMAVFFIFNFVRAFFLPDVSVALQWTTRALVGFLLFIIFGLVEKKTRVFFLWHFVLGGVVCAVIAVWQFLMQSSFGSSFFGIAFHDASLGGTSVVEASGGRWLRAYGLLSHPNILGAYMVAVMVALFTLVSVREASKKILQSVLVACGVVCTAALFFSFSRAAWVVGIFLGAVFVIYSGKEFFKTRGVASAFASWCATFLCLSFIFAPLVITRATAEGRLEQKSVGERIELLTVAKEIFIEHPFVGSGQGHFVYAFEQARPGKEIWQYQPVHNVFLLMVAEQGVIGVLLFFLFFVFWVRGIQTAEQRKWFLFAVVTLSMFFFIDHFWLTLPQGIWLLSFVPSVFTSYPLLSRKSH